MTPTAAALALVAEQQLAGRRAAVREIDLDTARAIARGRVPYIASDIETSLLDEVEVNIDTIEDVEITWTAHTGQPPGMIERLPWYPGTPLPDQTQFASCTVSAPLQT